MKKKKNTQTQAYCQYGCGLSCPAQFINFDCSPTLRLQKIPLFGAVLRKKMSVVFPEAVQYGDIIKGLPVPDGTMRGIYCSHTLEHLALHDLRIALKNTYRLLAPDGLFRCVVPDLEWACEEYLRLKKQGKTDAASVFLETLTMLGKTARPRGLMQYARELYGNSAHLWMWDFDSLASELALVGFQDIRRASIGDSIDRSFDVVEDANRFKNCLAIECRRLRRI